VRNTALAETIASIKGFEFAGEFDPLENHGAPLYFVPHRTVVSDAVGQQLGIRTADDLFGGLAPSQCFATKTIMHGLVGQEARHPVGWSPVFSDVISHAVLPGYAVFSRDDASRAGEQLLRDGLVRCKRSLAAGGLGQQTVATLAELDQALADLDECELTNCGLVLERHLDDVVTYSVGQVQLNGLRASYYGIQRLTLDNHGEAVYGGSDLVVVRGGFDDLLRLDVPDSVRLAIAQAATFDLAVQEHYPWVIASRRNYDVGQGYDASGRRLSGVLDQSWRIGGASGPEIAAVRAFQNDPSLQLVEASSYERYGAGGVAPGGAIVHFDGVDPDCGPIQLYTLIHRMERGAAWSSRSTSRIAWVPDLPRSSPAPLEPVSSR
jgi:hypothetical protein